MEIFHAVLLFTVISIGIVILGELFVPPNEGFDDSGKPIVSFWSSFASPRSDIGPTQEDKSYIRDPRYFNDYTDVGRLSLKYDFCRMLAPVDDEKNLFFACALAGTDYMDSAKFRTPSVSDGFRISKDDYMRDINGTGRNSYCRILPYGKYDDYQPVCNYALDTGFNFREVVDSDPPEHIVTLIDLYEGCVMWLRFATDMDDYVNKVNIKLAGNMTIDETPSNTITQGLSFNGSNQYVRIFDTPSLSLGMKFPMRSIRAWSVWVYFEEFTNNAKIFDFGNGSANCNVTLGILGRGDAGCASNKLQETICDQTSTIPGCPSGAQPVEEVSPQELMKTTDGNINEFTCPKAASYARELKHASAKKEEVNTSGIKNSATLLYEVWELSSRKMSLKLNNAIPIKEWTQIVVTVTNDDSFRPNMAIFINSKPMMSKDSGYLPTTGSMTNCYLGKSNWTNQTSQYANKDALFKGKIFDFRAYTKRLDEGFIDRSYDWGKDKLALK